MPKHDPQPTEEQLEELIRAFTLWMGALSLDKHIRQQQFLAKMTRFGGKALAMAKKFAAGGTTQDRLMEAALQRRCSIIQALYSELEQLREDYKNTITANVEMGSKLVEALVAAKEADAECEGLRRCREIDRQEIQRLESHIAREKQDPDPEAPSPAFERWRCRAHTAELVCTKLRSLVKEAYIQGHCDGDNAREESNGEDGEEDNDDEFPTDPEKAWSISRILEQLQEL